MSHPYPFPLDMSQHDLGQQPWDRLFMPLVVTVPLLAVIRKLTTHFVYAFCICKGYRRDVARKMGDS
ncbi:hypothetical protein KIPB_013270, partial [Kipferlia bialata]|eukprot:g13270.t1